MRIKVHGIAEIGNLANDCGTIAAVAPVRLGEAVWESTQLGSRITQGIARAAAGPHGALYYKRIAPKRVSLLVGEFGPSPVQGSRFTGVSGSAGAMRDLTKAAKRTAPDLQRRVRRVTDGLFWP